MESTNQNLKDIKVNLIESNPCSVILSIEVPSQDVKNETEKVYNEIQKSANIQGFRIGKAPKDMVRKKYLASAREKTIDNLVNKTVFYALKLKDINPISYPSIEDISFDFDKEFVFKVKAECNPDFKVKDYKNIKINKEIIEITDKKVDENLEALRERSSKLEPSKSEIVESKHFLIVDYKAFKEEQLLTDLTKTNQLIDLSSPHIPPEFKKGLEGMKKGETREINVKMPENYKEEGLAGKEVVFEINLIEIKDKILPALDDELAKDFGIENMVELKSKIKQTLEEEEKNRQNQEMDKQIIESLLVSNKFSVPESMVKEQTQYLVARAGDYFKKNGIAESEYKKHVQESYKKYEENAEKDVRLSYVLNAIAKEEKIDATEEDFNVEMDKVKKSGSQKEQDVEKYFNENKNNIMSKLKETKIFDFLIKNAKIEEKIKVEK